VKLEGDPQFLTSIIVTDTVTWSKFRAGLSESAYPAFE